MAVAARGVARCAVAPGDHLQGWHFEPLTTYTFLKGQPTSSSHHLGEKHAPPLGYMVHIKTDRVCCTRKARDLYTGPLHCVAVYRKRRLKQRSMLLCLS